MVSKRLSGMVFVTVLCVLIVDLFPQDTIVFPTIVTGPAEAVGRFEVSLDALADGNAEVCFFGSTNDGGSFTIFILQSTPFDSWCRDSDFGSVGTRVTSFSVRDTGELQEGWITLQFDSPATILTSIETLILRADSGEVISSVSLPGVRPSRNFIASWLATNSATSAYAIVNPSLDEAAEVSLTFVAGKEPELDICDAEVIVPPGTRVARFWDEFVSECSFESTETWGYLELESSAPVALGALKVLHGEQFAFTALPIYSSGTE